MARMVDEPTRVIVNIDLALSPPLDVVRERMAEAFQGWGVLQLQVQEAMVASSALTNPATEGEKDDRARSCLAELICSAEDRPALAHHVGRGIGLGGQEAAWGLRWAELRGWVEQIRPSRLGQASRWRATEAGYAVMAEEYERQIAVAR